ncbi:MAG: hypothetical protein ACRDWW_10735 [Acidimicrobiales bacterium]
MQELPPASRRTDGAIERRWDAGLTPLELAVRRRNRRWLGVIALLAVILGVAGLVAAVVSSRQVPKAKPANVPAGYRTVSDGIFAYAVPSAWQQNIAYTDDVGDLDTSGTSGWAAEHVGVSSTAPGPQDHPPSVFTYFGEVRSTPFTLGPAVTMRVPGAAVAYRYDLTRQGGFSATAVDAWQSSTGAQLWLLVHASPATTRTILASLAVG